MVYLDRYAVSAVERGIKNAPSAAPTAVEKGKLKSLYCTSCISFHDCAAVAAVRTLIFPMAGDGSLSLYNPLGNARG